MTDHEPFSRGWLLRQAEDAAKTMAALAKLLPGCFHADGTPIVASAYLPRLPDTAHKDKS